MSRSPLAEAWRSEAACVGEDPKHWLYVELGRPAEGADPNAYAKSVCATCPVREPCSKASPDSPGIWGGKTRTERKHARRGLGTPIAKDGQGRFLKREDVSV